MLLALAVAVAQWSVQEIALTGPAEAKVSGPGGIVQTVHSFWDGGTSHKIRWTPTKPGKWTYEVAGKRATVEVGPPVTGSHGFLRRDPVNPYHFLFDDSTRYFHFGTTYYEIMRSAVAGDDWKKAIDGSRSYGINKVRMLVNPAWKRKDNPYPVTEAFTDGRMNVKHFQALDRVVGYLLRSGVIADLILFTNADGAFATEAQDHAYARYVLARYAAYPNVIWCLTNEWNYTKHDRDYWNRLGRIMRAEDPYSGRGLSIHQQTRYDWNFEDQDWYTHEIVQLGVRNRGKAHRDTDEWAAAGKRHDVMRFGDDWGWWSIAYNRKRDFPVVNDEYGYIGEPDDQTEGKGITLMSDKHRRIMWGIAVAGGYASAGDKTEYSDGRPYMTAIWHDTPEYGDIRRLTDFWTKRGIEYWRMTPRTDEDSLRTRVYVLENQGREYVVYAAKGGSTSFTIPNGKYSVERFDPRTGFTIKLPNTAGGSVAFDLPDADWVLHIRRQN